MILLSPQSSAVQETFCSRDPFALTPIRTNITTGIQTMRKAIGARKINGHCFVRSAKAAFLPLSHGDRRKTAPEVIAGESMKTRVFLSVLASQVLACPA